IVASRQPWLRSGMLARCPAPSLRKLRKLVLPADASTGFQESASLLRYYCNETQERLVERQRDSYAHMARQPIVDRDRTVVGYELLFRNAPDAVAAAVRGSGTGETA